MPVPRTCVCVCSRIRRFLNKRRKKSVPFWEKVTVNKRVLRVNQNCHSRFLQLFISMIVLLSFFLFCPFSCVELCPLCPFCPFLSFFVLFCPFCPTVKISNKFYKNEFTKGNISNVKLINRFGRLS